MRKSKNEDGLFFNSTRYQLHKKALLYSIFIVVLFFMQHTTTRAQTTSEKTNWIANNPHEQPVFIENAGQFNANQDVNTHLQGNESIHYVASNDGINFIFTSTGLLYQYYEPGKRQNKTESEIEKKGEKNKKDKFPKGKSFFLKMEWMGANKNADIVAEKKASNYFTYPNPQGGTITARAFKKIIYKNVYPYTDIEYVFQENKKGIKYSIILHPGANPNLLQINYNGTQNITKDKEGNIIISSDFGDFKEHAPISFYDDNTPVASAFVVNKNTVAFTLDKKTLTAEGKVAKGHSLIIDPWVVTPTVPAENKIFEIGKDTLNNVYIFGGISDASIQKYTAAGTLLWTYNTGWIGSSWYGDMAVSPSGLIYLTGYGTIGGEIKKIDNTGNQVWFTNTVQNVANGENWRCAYNCDYSKLLVAYCIGTSDVYTVDVATNSVGQSTTTFASNGEIRALVRGLNGSFYGLTIDGTSPQQIALSSSFAPTYSIPSGQTFSYLGFQYNGWGGQNAIAANTSFIYSADGSILLKRDINTGTVLATTIIPNGIAERNSGIDVDDCGNVYCGSQSKVYKFNSSLVLVDSVSTPAAVYDLTLGENGEIFACGDGFLTSLNMTTCPIISCACIFPQTTNADCNGASNGTATINPSGIGPFTYLWSNGQTTPTATGLSIGTHTVTVTSGTGCVTTGEFKISPMNAALTLVTNSELDSNCVALNNGTAAVAATPGSEPYTYLWNSIPPQTNDTAMGLPAGNYSVIVTDTYGCKDTVNAPISEQGAPLISVYTNIASCEASILLYNIDFEFTFTYAWSTGDTSSFIYVTAPGAYSYTVTSTDSAGCAFITTGTVNIGSFPAPWTISSVDVISSCANNSGAITVHVDGATGGIFYNWQDINGISMGTIIDNTLANLAPGTYTCKVYDPALCQDTTLTFTIEAELNVVVNNPTGICAGESVNLTANGGDTYTWSPATGLNTTTGANVTASPTSNTTYTVIGTSGACADTTTVTVSIGGLNIASTPAFVSVCSGDLVTLSATGANSYTWNPATNLSATTGASVTATPTSNITYTITGTSGSCTDTATVTVIIGGLTIASTPALVSVCSGDTVTLSASGASGYSWSPATNLSATTGSTVMAYPQSTITYTVTGTTANCSGTSTSTINIYPISSVNAGNDLVVAAGETVTLTATGSGSYLWNTGQTTPSITVNPLVTTTYYVSLTDGNGCLYSDSVRVEINCMELNMPNVYTPNQDGVNDLFGPSVGAGCALNEYNFMLYNRWGKLLFESHDISAKWNGKYKNDSCSEGVYYYLVDYTFKGDTKKSKQGFVSLYR